MPVKSKKQEKTMEAIKHGWKPSDPSLKKVTPADARQILGEHKKRGKS